MNTLFKKRERNIEKCFTYFWQPSKTPQRVKFGHLYIYMNIVLKTTSFVLLANLLFTNDLETF